jgi:hypothetical protein
MIQDRCLNRRRWVTRLSVSLLAPLAACGGGSGDGADLPPEAVFRADGLSGRIVRRLRATPQGLVAGTDDGVFTRTESGWQPIGLSAAVVNDIVWMAQDHLLASPSVAKGIRHVMGQPQRLLVSGEGGIVQTLDGGISWQTLLADHAHRFYFDVLHDVQRPRRSITAAWEKNFDQPQPLVLRVSDDDGLSWHRIEHWSEPADAWSRSNSARRGRCVAWLQGDPGEAPRHRGGTWQPQIWGIP